MNDEDGKHEQNRGPAFSYRELADRTFGDTDLMAKLLITFLKDTPGQLAAIKKAIEADDGDSLCRLIHRLRGAAGTVSARRMWKNLCDAQPLCSSGRTPPGDGDYITLKRLVKELHHEFDLFYKAAKEEIDLGE